ncbi:ADAM 17-like protease [Ylistrum balloti]|uniref:ADAM 17-like protease n=1 Tax=Ylistrum balloti TaxID=509963 RepID=UPI002905A68D|nr:ADAM 17-like protease [Ylistrum balloti]
MGLSMDSTPNFCSFCVLSVFITLFLVFEVPCVQSEDLQDDKLTASLHYFEVLHSHDVRHRTKRYVDPENTNDFHQVWITAFGKQFHLSMKKSMILSHDFHTTLIHRNGSSQNVHSNSYDFYSGTLHGEEDTLANVYWEDGVPTASIVTADEVYFVEPAGRYASAAHNHTLIVYRKSDLKVAQDPWDGLTGKLKTSCKHQRNTSTADLQQNQEEKGQSRRKRAVDFGNRKYCRIILVADHYFHKHIGHSSILATQNYMIGVLDRVNTIYKATRWPDDSGVSGLGFEISKIIIHIEPSEGKHYNQANRQTNMEETLDDFSAEFFLNSACLVHLFTSSSFQQGLGLAYVASWRSGEFGGMCSPTNYDYKIAGNTGLTSLRNRAGNTVLTLQSTITTAHGHNWGSGHDNADSAECKDFYIMYPTSQEGTYSNNVIFSPCSRRSVYKVLETKGMECLKEKNPYFAYCGNGRLDSGEECDSGTRSDACCTDKCLLTSGSDCSPYNKACCSQCKLASAGTVCLQNVDDNFACKGDAQCDGFRYDCPPPSKKTDNTSCHDAGKCIDGNCVGFCQLKGMIPCVCSPESGLACYRCCRHSSDSKCISFTELLDDGRTCYQGYCQAGVCIKSPSRMNKFWNALTSDIISSFDVFMRNNIVFFITLFSAIIWLPSVMIFEHFENKKHKMDNLLVKRQVNQKMREKVDILPEENMSTIQHIGSLSVSGLRSSHHYRDTSRRTSNHIPEPQQEYARHSSTLPKSSSQPLYTDYQRVSTLPQSWKPGGYDRKAQRIQLTVNNLSELRQQTTNVSRQNYSHLPVTQPRKYPSNIELGREMNTLPYTIREPVDRSLGYDTDYYNNKARTLPLPVRGMRHDTQHKPSNIDRYTSATNEPSHTQYGGYPSVNQQPLTFIPMTLRTYETNGSHAHNSRIIQDDRQHFVPISHRSSDTDHESTPRNAPHSYYYHENPYEDAADVSRTPRGYDSRGDPISYERLPSNYGPMMGNSPRQPPSNEHLPGNQGNYYNDNRHMNLGYDGDSMTETMI